MAPPSRTYQSSPDRHSLHKVKTHSIKSPDQVNRRNERERKRVQNLNSFYHVLAAKLTVYSPAKNKKFSKKETLRTAIEYIKYLEQVLQNDGGEENYPEIASPMDANTSSSASSTLSMESSFCYTQYCEKTEPSSPNQMSHGYDSTHSSPNYPFQNYTPVSSMQQQQSMYYSQMQPWKGSPAYHQASTNYYVPTM